MNTFRKMTCCSEFSGFMVLGLLSIFSFVLLFSSCSKQKEEPKIILANSKRAVIKVHGENRTRNWTISPQVNPDIFAVEIDGKDSMAEVSFTTDLDSISFQMKIGDQQDFIVLLNGKDSAFTSFRSVPPKVVFSDDYVKEHKGKWSVEVIEAQELLQVIFAITPTGLADTRSMIINHDTTDYYKSVIKNFSSFKEETIVEKMDSLLKKNRYINLKADACTFVFNENDVLEKSKTYDRMRGSYNLLDPYVSLLNDFAQKSGFRSFYQRNRPLYDSLVAWHERAIPTKRQWDWLERQFPDHSYDNYRITFSPLVKGNHSTVRFNNNNFKQAVMFIAPPHRVKNVNEQVSEGLVTRIVFTEIDHNYVNPESNKHIKKINEYFKNKEFWTAGKESKGYNSPYSIFNEYMTWSVYLLYCYDTYKKEDFEVINDWVVNYIINRRGFNRFDDFHNTLLELYKNREESTTVSGLYEPLLKWAETYNE